jgi:CheY-like chemotaxis protein
LLNLCSNAVKFTDSGSVTLSVRETFNGVQFNVIDTGIGMEEKHLEQVFDSFSQGDSSISRRFGGSGLGLCLSEQLANLMQGSISVTSEINKGSEFILHLNVPKLTLEQQPTLKRMTTAPIFEGRVLLAEDHPDNRELITRFLTQLGLTVVAVENGLKAVEECNKSFFDIVLLDIQMPVLNGIDALKQLKENGFTKPIIAITANTMQHEISSYLEQGFFDHIKKPLDQKYFISTLSKYLNQCHKNSEISNIKVSKIIENTDLVERFIANLAKEKTHLSDLYQTQNWHELQNQLHKLRGAAAIFEFYEIESAADYFEKAIKFNDEQAYQAAYEGINFALTEHLA